MSRISTHNNADDTKRHVDTNVPLSVSIRAWPGSYFTVLFITAFAAAFLFYLEYFTSAFIFACIGWPLILWLAYTDRLLFDGKRIRRTGFAPKAWAFLNNSRNRLKLSDIEQVETQAVRTLKRGGSVYYRYRTTVRGKGVVFSFASGGEDFRRMIKAFLPMLSDNVLDNRSIELRDYLTERKNALRDARKLNIPPSDVLESSFGKIRTAHKKASTNPASDEEIEKADHLRKLANELRLAGSLPQAVETFRRALRLKPADGWILFEFARCMQSFASAERDHRLERRSVALLRLAERRAGNDEELLSRLGETYFQVGEWHRAGIVFRRAIDTVGESFRSLRGMAEIALREGKIAHVIHNFAAANRLSENAALRRWTKGEVEYFSRLNDDEEYMEMEVSRVNLLDSLHTAKGSALRITLIGFPVIAAGLFLEDSLIANTGWAVSSVSLIIWAGLILMLRLLSARIPFELMEDD